MFGHSSSVLKRCTLAESLFLLAENSQNVGTTSILSVGKSVKFIRFLIRKKRQNQQTLSLSYMGYKVLKTLYLINKWCPRKESNLRPAVQETDALSTELRRHIFYSIFTFFSHSILTFRRRMLYPTELLGHIMILTQFCKINDCFYMVFLKHLLIAWIY